MDEEREVTPPTQEDTIRAVLAIILFFAVLFVLSAIFLPSMQASVHPPQVNIVRDGEYVQVIWMGGTDDPFVGNFTVTIDNETGNYPKPNLYQPVASIYHPEYVCVNVEAYDKAIRIYRPIGYNCT